MEPECPLTIAEDMGGIFQPNLIYEVETIYAHDPIVGYGIWHYSGVVVWGGE
jgi:hypothetical protein